MHAYDFMADEPRPSHRRVSSFNDRWALGSPAAFYATLRLESQHTLDIAPGLAPTRWTGQCCASRPAHALLPPSRTRSPASDVSVVLSLSTAVVDADAAVVAWARPQQIVFPGPASRSVLERCHDLIVVRLALRPRRQVFLEEFTQSAAAAAALNRQGIPQRIAKCVWRDRMRRRTICWQRGRSTHLVSERSMGGVSLLFRGPSNDRYLKGATSACGR